MCAIRSKLYVSLRNWRVAGKNSWASPGSSQQNFKLRWQCQRFPLVATFLFTFICRVWAADEKCRTQLRSRSSWRPRLSLLLLLLLGCCLLPLFMVMLIPEDSDADAPAADYDDGAAASDNVQIRTRKWQQLRGVFGGEERSTHQQRQSDTTSPNARPNLERAVFCFSFCCYSSSRRRYSNSAVVSSSASPSP